MFFKVTYWIMVFLLRFYMRCLFWARASGREYLVKTGGFIVSANHTSNYDPVMVAAFLPRKLGFLAKRELFKNKFFTWFLSGMSALPITRGGSDIGTLKLVISSLRQGKSFLVFPEGTRKEINPEDVKSGAVLFAIKGQVPIQPAYISGEYRLFGKVRIRYGPPVYYTEYYNKRVTPQELHRLSLELMDVIQGLGEEQAPER